MGEKIVISIQNLNHQFRKSGFRISIPAAAFDQEGITALVGSNGNGKSTLLGIIGGVLKPDSGIVRYKDLDSFREYEKIKAEVHLLSWEFSLFPWAKGSTLLAMVKKSATAAGQWDEGTEEKLKSELSIPMNQLVNDMSRGERAKLMLMLTLPRNPKVLLIDEITNDLDISSRKLIYKKLDEYSFETGARVIIATNIITDMERYATNIACMRQGEILFARTLDDLKDRHKKIFLKARTPGASGDPAVIHHRTISWNGSEGILYTDNFRPEALETLNSLGIDATLEALSLEEILSGYGE